MQHAPAVKGPQSAPRGIQSGASPFGGGLGGAAGGAWTGAPTGVGVSKHLPQLPPGAFNTHSREGQHGGGSEGTFGLHSAPCLKHAASGLGAPTRRARLPPTLPEKGAESDVLKCGCPNESHTHWLPPGSSFSKLVSTPALTDLILSAKITPMIAQGSREDHLRVAPARTMRGVRLSTQTRSALPLEPPRPVPRARARPPARPLSPGAAGCPAAAAPARNAPPISSPYIKI